MVSLIEKIMKKKGRTLVVGGAPPIAQVESQAVLEDQWSRVIWPYLRGIVGVVDDGYGNHYVVGDKWEILGEKIVPSTNPRTLDSVAKWLGEVKSISDGERGDRVGTGELAALVRDFWTRLPGQKDGRPNIERSREIIHQMRLEQDQAYMVAYYVNSVIENALVSAKVRRAVYEDNNPGTLRREDMIRIIKEAAKGK